MIYPLRPPWRTPGWRCSCASPGSVPAQREAWRHEASLVHIHFWRKPWSACSRQRLGVLWAESDCCALWPSDLMHSFAERPAPNPAHSSQVSRREGGQTGPETPHHLESMGYSPVPQKKKRAPMTTKYVRKETISATSWTNFISQSWNGYGIISANGDILI